MRKYFLQIQVIFFVFLAICMLIQYTIIADTVKYKYDDAGRLIEADYGDKTITYNYDNAGNLLERGIAESTIDADPVPDIKANGSDNTVTIGTGETLSITVSLDAGDSSGTDFDWWVVVNTPTGEWEYYDLTQGVFTSGLSVTFQGALFNLGSTVILNASGLGAGTYTYYFGVDMDMNGSLDLGELFFDSVEVNVTQ